MTQISWGTKIAALYISFVGLVIVMVTFSMNQKIELVSSDYYAKELKYQDKINEMNNANALSDQIKHTIGASQLEIQFPVDFKDKHVAGEILFFKPSDATKDYKTPIQINADLKQTISKSLLSSGMYKMQISWTVDGKNYFNESIIVLP
ncbi:MAG: FixH family protein [Bacteroidia bacterium]|nr:FixH family protein [Bacteroidia bacterium]